MNLAKNTTHGRDRRIYVYVATRAVSYTVMYICYTMCFTIALVLTGHIWICFFLLCLSQLYVVMHLFIGDAERQTDEQEALAMFSKQMLPHPFTNE